MSSFLLLLPKAAPASYPSRTYSPPALAHMAQQIDDKKQESRPSLDENTTPWRARKIMVRTREFSFTSTLFHIILSMLGVIFHSLAFLFSSCYLSFLFGGKSPTDESHPRWVILMSWQQIERVPFSRLTPQIKGSNMHLSSLSDLFVAFVVAYRLNVTCLNIQWSVVDIWACTLDRPKRPNAKVWTWATASPLLLRHPHIIDFASGPLSTSQWVPTEINNNDELNWRDR